MIVAGVKVNSNPGDTCHQFTARWMAASRKLLDPSGNYLSVEIAGNMSKELMVSLLTKNWRGDRARTSEDLKAPTGSVIAFWNHGDLAHTMVADNRLIWVGRNNNFTFGTNESKILVNNIKQKDKEGENERVYWMDSDNQLMGFADNILDVTYFPNIKRLLMKDQFVKLGGQ